MTTCESIRWFYYPRSAASLQRTDGEGNNWFPLFAGIERTSSRPSSARRRWKKRRSGACLANASASSYAALVRRHRGPGGATGRLGRRGGGRSRRGFRGRQGPPPSAGRRRGRRPWPAPRRGSARSPARRTMLHQRGEVEDLPPAISAARRGRPRRDRRLHGVGRGYGAFSAGSTSARPSAIMLRSQSVRS